MSNVGPVEFAKAIADGTRQEIMRACCCQWVSVGDLATQIEKSQPTVSHHLAILREADLVHVRHDGKQSFYSLNQSRVMACCGQLMLVFAPELAAPVAADVADEAALP
jgi:DNA-binding transcriptional ArsR family regulator